ncbi:MAG: arsenic transporter [Rhizomicrobium sp.]
MPFAASAFAIWTIAALSTACVVIRPLRLPEAIWAVSGAVSLVALGLLPMRDALVAIANGSDVYLFLVGMMLLSEIARREGLFDWVAALAVGAAQGSGKRLFVLVYAVGIAVTAILSNDATAVVLTPAVFAAATKARVDPLPFLFICALVANAASFVLPISNPANLLVYDGHMPPLIAWLSRFSFPSLLAIVATFFALRWAERDRLAKTCALMIERPPLSSGGKTALAGIALAAVLLLAVSALDIPLGLPTAILGVATALVVLVSNREAPWPALKEISWSIVPLVAGLFVFVAALARTGVIVELVHVLREATALSAMKTAAGAGGSVAVAANLMNNLPVGLVASSMLAQAHAPQSVADSVLIGVDLGPNLSVTGSLATILWLTAIRREGEDVNFWRFLKVGVVVMPPALVLALGARLVFG